VSDNRGSRDNRDPGLVTAECRWRDCKERTPEPVTTRGGLDWIEAHGREAHGSPHVGARWTFVREPRPARAEGRASRG
jgi:hypothetical protein